MFYWYSTHTNVYTINPDEKLTPNPSNEGT